MTSFLPDEMKMVRAAAEAQRQTIAQFLRVTVLEKLGVLQKAA